MDANERECAADVSTGSETAARLKRRIADKAQEAKENLNDVGRKTTDRIDSSRKSTANALEWTANSLHSRTNEVSDFAHSAAERIQDSADYLRETDVERIMEDVKRFVRRNPGGSLAAAAILGFLIARGLRRSSY